MMHRLDVDSHNLLEVYRGLLEEAEALRQLIEGRGMNPMDVPKAATGRGFAPGLDHVECETGECLFRFTRGADYGSYSRGRPVSDVEDLPWPALVARAS